MKKVIALLLATVLGASLLVGCSSNTSTPEVETNDIVEDGNVTEGSEGITVGVSLLNNAHVFFNNIEAALREKAAETNVTLIVQDAAGDANKQLSQVQDFITQKVDAIIISPTNSAGSKSMVELADQAGIPIFTMYVASDGDVVSHVATDNYTGGKLAAQESGNNNVESQAGEVAVITQ